MAILPHAHVPPRAPRTPCSDCGDAVKLEEAWEHLLFRDILCPICGPEYGASKVAPLRPPSAEVTGPRLGDWTFTGTPTVDDRVDLPNGTRGVVTWLDPHGTVASVKSLTAFCLHYIGILPAGTA